MPEVDRELMARLDGAGERAGREAPAMPAALRSAVAARGAVRVAPRSSMPRAAFGAAAAVIAVGVALVAVRGPVVTRDGRGVRALSPGEGTVLWMTERFCRGASIDAAVGSASDSGGGPSYRALDAYTGMLRE